MSGSKPGEKRGRMKMREQEDRCLERTVWSQPGLSTFIWERRVILRAANDVFVAALHKAMGR